MQITFEVDDQLIPSIDQYLMTQARYEMDELTKTQKIVRTFKDSTAFLQDALHQVVHQIVLQYPPDHIRDQMAQAKAIQDKIKEVAKPAVVA
jgi:hypothetical protein